MDSEILVVLNFQRLAKMGETGSIGFKLSTCKVLDFSHTIARKGCPTVVQLYKKNSESKFGPVF